MNHWNSANKLDDMCNLILKNWGGKKQSEKTRIRNQKRQKHLSLAGRSWTWVVIFFDALGEPPFPTWIQSVISSTMKEGETMDKNIIHMSMPPTLEATAYWSMYGFGNHLHISNVEEHLTTCDSGVVAVFEQECIYGPNDQRPMLAKLEYVGWIEEILIKAQLWHIEQHCAFV